MSHLVCSALVGAATQTGDAEGDLGGDGDGCAVMKDADYADVLVTSMAEMPGLVLTWLLIDRLGRRRSQGVFFALVGAVLFLLPAIVDRSNSRAQLTNPRCRCGTAPSDSNPIRYRLPCATLPLSAGSRGVRVTSASLRGLVSQRVDVLGSVRSDVY